MSTLSHQEIYKDSGRAAVELPLGDALGALGAGATFPLMEDPRQTNRALLIGMFRQSLEQTCFGQLKLETFVSLRVYAVILFSA